MINRTSDKALREIKALIMSPETKAAEVRRIQAALLCELIVEMRELKDRLRTLERD